MATHSSYRWAAILCADWSGSARDTRQVYVAIPSTRTLRRLTTREGWSVQAVLDAAGEFSKHGPVLVGFDAPIGMPRSLWGALTPGVAPFDHFARWLTAYEELEALLEPVTTAEEWKPQRPFFRVPKGKGSRQRFEHAARAAGVELWRDIDRRTGARSPFIASGIPGAAGGSARAVWRELATILRGPTAPVVWPFGTSLDDAAGPSLVVAEIYPRLASGIALGRGPRPWPMPQGQPEPRVGLIELRDAGWIRTHGVAIADHEGFEEDENAFDALISAAAMLRLVLEALPLSDPAHDDPVAEGGMLGSGAIRWTDDPARRPKRPRREGTPLATITIEPSFGTELEIELWVRQTGQGRTLFASCAAGDDRWEEELAPEAAGPVLEALSKARVPLKTGGGLGLDGTSFRVSVADGSSHSTFEWRRSTPPGWEPLGALVDLLHAAVSRRRYT